MRNFLMKRIYEFKCEIHGIFEEYVEYSQEHTCPTCGQLSPKIISAPQIKLEGITGAFPGAAMSWEKKHIEKLAQERKKESS